MHGALSRLMDVSVLWFEIPLLLSPVPNLVWLLLSKRPWPFWLRVVPWLSALAAVGELLIEGFRWHMAPLAVLLAWLLALDTFFFKSTTRSPRALASVGLIALLASAVLYFGLPAKSLPEATGPFAVGTTVLHLTDIGRRETLDAGNHGPRELMIQIWYPVNPAANRSPTAPAIDAVRSWLDHGKARERFDAPISNAQSSYPVLIFCPSWHGQRGQNFFQVRELVSHGFIVVGIDHPYGSAVTTFPGGRVARAQLLPFEDLSSEQALQASIAYIEKQLQVRVKDVEFVVAELEKDDLGNGSNLLSGHFDLSRLGIFGYSFGGCVTAQACWLDKRFKAGLDLDGSIFGEVANDGVRQPFLFLFETSEPPGPGELRSANLQTRLQAELNARDIRIARQSVAKYGSFLTGVDGTRHVNFTDPPTTPTIGYYLSDTGSIDIRRGLQIINARTLAFFEKYLNHAAPPTESLR
jgi:dienelactone hydrolase